MSDSTTLIPNLNEIMKEYTELGNQTEQGSQATAMQVEDREDENEKQQQKGEGRREKNQEKENGELMKPKQNR